MKGIILAAGKGTRLYPATVPCCKPLVTVYDKPLIYYPLALMIMAGIKDVLIIVPPGDMEPFIRLFDDGEDLGINISYKEQKVQRGIADAFIIGKRFIGKDSVCLALGDNIFYHPKMADMLKEARGDEQGASVFGYWVPDPRPFGVVEFDKTGKAISIEEKPQKPKSNYVIPGLYFYDNDVIEIAEKLKPSSRGELEITDVNVEYMKREKLRVVPMCQGVEWMDAGNADSLLEASIKIKDIQNRDGQIVACLERLAMNEGYITQEQVHSIGKKHMSTAYGQYLLSL
ncbi:glucose-1-phosphate thymidylyltransferase RfbA [Enterococcus faecium]|uniref:glucose-1-phosphate thymidylyltransferase RfbA n=1 Tax=Enterococcus faecium TaxID=1352 RepID=UPI0029538DCC|nr:glucose-1-phosphate thymidylyltransferase RfbA [Enterococcus faecium]MDV7750017.1 glucose-1-phosphate thymidylyltransferase RfbA [Enterococcus faecium]